MSFLPCPPRLGFAEPQGMGTFVIRSGKKGKAAIYSGTKYFFRIKSHLLWQMLNMCQHQCNLSIFVSIAIATNKGKFSGRRKEKTKS